MDERCTSVYERLGKKSFGRMTADGWLAKAAGVVAAGRAQAALEAFVRRLKGWDGPERAYERCTCVYERCTRDWAKSFGRMTADGWLAKAAGVVAGGGHRPRWRPLGGG